MIPGIKSELLSSLRKNVVIVQDILLIDYKTRPLLTVEPVERLDLLVIATVKDTAINKSGMPPRIEKCSILTR